MNYQMIEDRHSGGCYGEEDESIQCPTEGTEDSEDELFLDGSCGLRGARSRLSTGGHSRSGSDEMEELCW
ncbi:MAG: hypothetical protein IPN71_19165 [Fibrobacteres bacterium]|jgi:hypothetical protein|nr:hypothetical protein [Fibrobacterota bacterium]